MVGSLNCAVTDGRQKVLARNVYIADTANGTLRKLVPTTGAVTTFAGSASAPGSADGTGAAARFNAPSAVTADGAGNLYIADLQNHTIRAVVLSTGLVTTVAGSPGQFGSLDGIGAAARFTNPAGVAADGAGNLYVADGNYALRKIVLSTGVVTTVAGVAGKPGSTDGIGSAARFQAPGRLTADGAGNLYMADFAIRKIVLSTYEVSTLSIPAPYRGAGNGLGGVAADGVGNLYISDHDGCDILKVELTTGKAYPLAGRFQVPGSVDDNGTAAQFYSPDGIALDGAGNLYVTDSTGGVVNSVRKIALATADVTTLVGMPGLHGPFGIKLGPLPAQLSGPVALAVSRGQLIILDQFENSVLAVR